MCCSTAKYVASFPTRISVSTLYFLFTSYCTITLASATPAFHCHVTLWHVTLFLLGDRECTAQSFEPKKINVCGMLVFSGCCEWEKTESELSDTFECHCVHADCREIKHKEKTSKELCHIQSDWDMRYFVRVCLFKNEYGSCFLSRLCQHQAEESVKSLLFQLLCLLGENSRGHFPGQFLFRKRQGYSRRWQ